MRALTLSFLDKHRDAGLLLMRVGVGVMYLMHGWPKISDPGTWERYGGAMTNLGIEFAPAFWGFMAAFAEFGGGLLLIVGLLTRPAAAMMAFTMFVAALMHYMNSDPFGIFAHPTKMIFVFLGLVLIGAGRYSLDALLTGGQTPPRTTNVTPMEQRQERST